MIHPSVSSVSSVSQCFPETLRVCVSPRPFRGSGITHIWNAESLKIGNHSTGRIGGVCTRGTR